MIIKGRETCASYTTSNTPALPTDQAFTARTILIKLTTNILYGVIRL